jgi:cytochrome c oxidase subunit 2
MHIPVGRPVNVALQSDDVIHSFWVPKLAGKRDMIPNHTNYIWFTPQNTGTYYGQCAEFCGISHANMSFRVVVDTPAAFDAWIKAQQAPPATPATAQEKAGATAFTQATCGACHTIGGTTAPGFPVNGLVITGPNLSHVGSRTTLAAGLLANSTSDLERWLTDPGAVKPGNEMAAMIGPAHVMLSSQQVSDLTAYLESLK